MFILFCLCLLLGVANAKQTKHTVKKSSDEWSFVFAWTDSTWKRHKASFQLDADLVMKGVVNLIDGIS